jgi:hypothetical protein
MQIYTILASQALKIGLANIYYLSITGSQDWACKYILSLICFVRMDFSEQYHIEGKARDVVRSPF